MLSQTKYESAHRDLNALSKKVYEAVPMAEAWPISRIVTELGRKGSVPEFRVVNGAVSGLVDRGLVVEVSRGQFRRAPVREKAIQTIVDSTPIEAKTREVVEVKQIEHKGTPFDRLGVLSARFVELSSEMKSISEEIGNIAIEFQQSVEDNSQDIAKLRQLQALLKGLGGT